MLLDVLADGVPIDCGGMADGLTGCYGKLPAIGIAAAAVMAGAAVVGPAVLAVFLPQLLNAIAGVPVHPPETPHAPATQAVAQTLTAETAESAPPRTDVAQKGAKEFDPVAQPNQPERPPRTTPAAGQLAPSAPELSQSQPEGDLDRSPDAHIDKPDLPQPDPGQRPVQFGQPLGAVSGKQPPLFDGPVTRDQVVQGDLGDCGTLATIGGVAGHRPSDITSAIQQNPDGTYTVTLHKAVFLAPDRTVPTGQTLELTVTPDVPVYSSDQTLSAYADQTETGVAWASIMEKAMAGVDQTWNARRAAQSSPARGYERLDEGTNAGNRAELLTQLTGQPAVVRSLNKTPGNEAAAAAELRACLDNQKPVIIGVPSPPPGVGRLPHDLVGGHAYEVTSVENGIVKMRNPWGFKHPTPMTMREFLDNVRDVYTTLE
ncbi:C2 family cysteine protease [Plantactinospora sp. CA-294935]|uniref:C2 family cysteine protease n=1 Tax=Plantactinospora sp. CA-294935 TaxID=3240012 RepID=UPI003D8AFAA8